MSSLTEDEEAFLEKASDGLRDNKIEDALIKPLAYIDAYTGPRGLRRRRGNFKAQSQAFVAGANTGFDRPDSGPPDPNVALFNADGLDNLRECV